MWCACRFLLIKDIEYLGVMSSYFLTTIDIFNYKLYNCNDRNA